MPRIVLATLNAKYSHASFALRYLLANLGDLRSSAVIREFDINQRPLDILESLLADDPRVVALGVYIWNAEQSLRLVGDLKRVRPDITVILGGPEVSHETDRQEITRLADYTITGEADLAFRELCAKLLAGEKPATKTLAAPLPSFDAIALPYDLYTDEDIAHRVVYVEASRGCPFSCEFCLSSLDVPVRNVPLEPFLAAMQRLLDRGLRQFKFVDRTFNLNLAFSSAILQFFLDRYTPGLFVHFEMIPDRLPEKLRALIAQFPAGALQFEVGIQTFNNDVAALISRRQDYEKLADNLRFLREETGVHVHADLIAGLPGEDAASFAAGFDRLVAMGPQEVQLGILKRLRGTPIVRHDGPWQMVYSPNPPYEVLSTKLLSFAALQRLRRIARFWDSIANSGKFARTAPLIWAGGKSPFDSMSRLSDWLYAQVGRTHAIALPRLAELLFRWLTEHEGHAVMEVAEAMARDLEIGGVRNRPQFLRDHVGDKPLAPASASTAPARQARHLAAGRD
jgi:radical SAM superfamily enzyme YgiQ (UPF0313 family)